MSRTGIKAASKDKRMASPLVRLTAEFKEMPGLRLTTKQTARLIGVDVETAATTLEALVQRGFLKPTASGYIRA